MSALACLAASLINPYTYHLHVHMAQYLRDPWNSQHIMEFLSPSFHHPTAIFFEAMLVLGAVAACWNLPEGTLYGAAADAGVGAWRAAGRAQYSDLHDRRRRPLLPPRIAAVAAPGCRAGTCAGWVRDGWRANSTAWRRETDETEAVAALAPGQRCGGFALVAAVICAPHPPQKFRAEFDPQRYPAAALATLRPDRRRAHLHQRRVGRLPDLAPLSDNRVFVDGRSDFYGNDFEDKYHRRYECEIRLGEDPGRLRRQHDFNAPRRAADRRVEGIQPLARRL